MDPQRAGSVAKSMDEKWGQFTVIGCKPLILCGIVQEKAKLSIFFLIDNFSLILGVIARSHAGRVARVRWLKIFALGGPAIDV